MSIIYLKIFLSEESALKYLLVSSANSSFIFPETVI